MPPAIGVPENALMFAKDTRDDLLSIRVLNDARPENAYAGMLAVTVKSKDSRDVQPVKTPEYNVVNLGKTTLVNAVQFLKAPDTFVASGNDTLPKDVQPEKAPETFVATGNDTLSKEVQS